MTCINLREEVERCHFLTDFNTYQDKRKNELSKEINFKEMFDKILIGLNDAKKLCINTNLKDIISEFNNYKSIYKIMDANLHNRICLLPFIQCFIYIDGEISPCCALYCNENISIGNIFNNNFKDLWNNKKFKTIRKNFKNKNNNFKVCKDCIPRDIYTLLKMSKMLPSFIK